MKWKRNKQVSIFQYKRLSKRLNDISSHSDSSDALIFSSFEWIKYFSKPAENSEWTEIKKLVTQNDELKIQDAKAHLNELESDVLKVYKSIEGLKKQWVLWITPGGFSEIRK